MIALAVLLTDQSGYSRHAPITGATWSTNTPSGKGCSLSFNGTTNYVATPVTTPIQANNFTITGWFKTSVGAGLQVAFSNSSMHPIHLNGTVMRLCVNGCSVGTTAMNDNKWHFIAVVGDNTSIRQYIDGRSVPEQTQGAVTTLISGTFYIGAMNSTSYFFNGLMDETRIFGRSLTSKEIHQLYVEGLRSQSITRK